MFSISLTSSMRLSLSGELNYGILFQLVGFIFGISMWLRVLFELHLE